MNIVPLSFRRKLALEIARYAEKQKIKEHPLRQLFWECTLRCNLNCKHCGSDCKKTAGFADMPKEDFLRVLDSITAKTDPHKVFVVVTGGEPLMRSDLEECGKAIYERGFPWGMVTNGLAMTEERLNSLMASGLHTATVSLDGFEDEHNWMRGNPQSFDRAVKAILLMARTPGLIFDIVTCVNRQSLPRLEEFKEFLISIGVKQWRIATIVPMGRASSSPELQLSNKDFRQVMEFIRKTRREGRIGVSYGCEGFLGNYEGEVRNHFFTCRAGITIGSVLADGSISACTSIRSDYRQGNIYENDFMEIWQNKFHPYRDRNWMKTGECADCKYFRYCKGNGLHLRDENGELYFCHLKRLKE